MSIEVIIQSLTELTSIHENLNSISEEKTEVVKEGSVDKLQQLLSKERKQILILEKAENKRQELVEKWFSEQKLPLNDMTITHMLEIITNEHDANRLEHTTIGLTKAITKLKQQEQLNQDLIRQSMQFVQMSLDMMSPTIKNMNYGKGKDRDTEGSKRSVFDSKA